MQLYMNLQYLPSCFSININLTGYSVYVNCLPNLVYIMRGCCEIENLLLCALFAALTAVSVYLPKIPIPGTPLMFTFQTFLCS